MPSFKLLEAAAAEPSFLQVVAMGLITVFVVLICLIIIIKQFSRILSKSPKSYHETDDLASPSFIFFSKNPTKKFTGEFIGPAL